MKRTIFLLGLLLPLFCSAAPQKVTVGEFQLEYELAGAGPGLILLEGGGGAGLEDWDPVFEQLSAFARVIRYARVGNGNSTQIRRHFSSDDYAAHASALLKALQVDEPVIYIAHSYGASVARCFAAHYPQQISALMLVEPASEHDVDIMRALDLERAEREIAQVKKDDMANGMSNQYLDFWSKRPLPNYAEIGDIPVTVIASTKKYDQPANLFFTDEAREAWGKLHRNWVETFPRGRFVATSKSYHFVQFDEPELVIAEVRGLLERAIKN
ncbi:alpha/beta fold hydrolase [Microbulbifer marinus]|uniref:Pimeloyl-ACP methyl ester carboxylesterase n=1 Tax=Microbulbifer marinus TaxID=658218 RepID=A0A1H3ZD83_9GAMM|nr:alpha/beta fold hydrolase [Microbulbifer marinus]SEA21610.1 Pimeloyl-ACP methyl ester carboxylesterase [Microbulbifer marinus]